MCRIVTVAVAIAAPVLLGVFFLQDFVQVLNGADVFKFNCRLPEAYWYFDSHEHNATRWSTTECALKPLFTYSILVCLMIFSYAFAKDTKNSLLAIFIKSKLQ